MFLLDLMADGFGWVSDHATVLATVVAAIAAIFVARFTVVLANVTGEQARLTNEGIKLARDEFNATHRPEIIVHFLEPIWGARRGEDGQFFQALNAKVTYFNKGSVPAKDVEIRGAILFLDVMSPLDAGFGAPILEGV